MVTVDDLFALAEEIQSNPVQYRSDAVRTFGSNGYGGDGEPTHTFIPIHIGHLAALTARIRELEEQRRLMMP